MARITPTTFLNSPLAASVVLEANLWFTLTRPSHCPPSHRTPFPGPVSSVRPKWPASLNSRPVLALGSFCLHRLIYSFRTLTHYNCTRHCPSQCKCVCFSGDTPSVVLWGFLIHTTSKSFIMFMCRTWYRYTINVYNWPRNSRLVSRTRNHNITIIVSTNKWVIYYSHLQTFDFKTRQDFQAILCYDDIRLFNFTFLLHHPIWVEEEYQERKRMF